MKQENGVGCHTDIKISQNDGRGDGMERPPVTQMSKGMSRRHAVHEEEGVKVCISRSYDPKRRTHFSGDWIQWTAQAVERQEEIDPLTSLGKNHQKRAWRLGLPLWFSW